MEKMKEDSNPTTIDQLPDDILLDIFGILYFEEICCCSQVCKRWSRLAHSLSLKSIIIGKDLEQPAMCHLLQQSLIPSDLESIVYLNNPDRDHTHLNYDLFLKLKDKCRGIKKLVFRKCLLTEVSLCDLPTTLRHLSLWGCIISLDELFCERRDDLDIVCLDLSGVNTCFTSETMKYLLMFKNLKFLYLENCYRINNGGVEFILPIIPQLVVLDLEGTDISNEIVRTILQQGNNLKELYLGQTCIDNNAISKSDKLCNISVLCLKNTLMTRTYKNQLKVAYSWVCILSDVQELKHSDADINYCCRHYLSHLCPK